MNGVPVDNLGEAAVKFLPHGRQDLRRAAKCQTTCVRILQLLLLRQLDSPRYRRLVVCSMVTTGPGRGLGTDERVRQPQTFWHS